MPKEQPSDIESFLTQLLQRINEIEEKERADKNKIDLLSSSIIDKNKKTESDINLIRENLKQLSDELDKVKQKLDYILAEMPNLARKEDISIIEKFIKMWQPLKYTTTEDVERIIEKKVREKKPHAKYT